ncbi:MAG TPA: phosphoglucosamine mutase [Alphaproteobacteria bacterium]|nr:phosphoglucosamine mutase [Micavibrio sp.]MBK9562808.1 phosphoglucosamine mutase [Micavibrio sp.]HQX27473.1 phosphoglucosamine mutase [Alphaproteobacteria bacterium]
MTRKYFGTDGIRGRANTAPMTADMALKIAMATASALREMNKKAGRERTNRAIIGKDTRLSGYMFEEAMCAGFVSMGMDVILVGPIPTPGIAMLTRSLRTDVGVMISASHNLFEDNGIKLFGPDGYKLPDDVERAIEVKIEGDLSKELALPADLGKATRLEDAQGRYIEHVKGSLPKGLNLEGLKIVVDCAHGAAYKVAPQVLWELEAEVISIGVAPNGRNINDGYGATATDALQKAVVEQKADIGIALDGDADRVIMVDEKGQKIDGDQLMAALALSMQKAGTLAQDTIVATVMSNLGLEKFLESKKIRMLRSQVGDRYVVETMREKGATLGGEQSGHIILSNHNSTGDGLVAALQVLALLKQQNKKASEALRVFNPLPQILRNVKFGTGAKPLDNSKVQDAIKSAEKKLLNDGRLLVRASGTEPLIRVMAEGQDSKLVENVVGDLCAVIEQAAR